LLSESNKVLFMVKFSVECSESQLTENTALMTEVVMQRVPDNLYSVL
jgi:hypothetical protein